MHSPGKFVLSDLESLIGASAVGLKYVSETSRHRGVRVEAGELLGGWQPESRIYTVVEEREIATADLIATDAASHRVVSYPDPGSHSCGWITSPLRVLYSILSSNYVIRREECK